MSAPVLETAQPATTARARIAALLGTRRSFVAALAGSSVVSGLAESAMLVTLATVATRVAQRHHGQASSLVGGLIGHAAIGTLFAFAALFALIRLCMQFPIAYLTARIGADVQAQLRKEIADAFTATSWAQQASDREGYLQDTMTSQVLQGTQGALQATTILSASINFTILMITALVINAKAAVVVALVAAGLLALLRPLRRTGIKRARELSRSQLDFASALSEMQRLAAESQVFGVEQAQRDRLEAFTLKARRLFLQSQTMVRLTPSVYQSMIFLLIIIGLYALYQISASALASLGAVILLLVRTGTSAQQIQGAQQALSQSLPFIERLQETARRYRDSIPVDGEAKLEGIADVAFARVSFAYREDTPVLQDVSFSVPAGETVGVIGPSGAGKSTLVQLLLQLREPTSGEYLVNGFPASGYRRADWHRLVSYVPQEPQLIHATVAENIRFLRDELTDDDIERAAKLSHIHDVIMSWPDGYETIVGPRADAVSGGQQQRICLARALAPQPAVLILDEPTSALDPSSEDLIQASLRELKEKLTIFIVAHRMSTLGICDRVMVIVDGRLAAFDPIPVLERESAYYRRATSLAAGELA